METKIEKKHNYSAIDQIIREIMRLTANEILAEYKAAGLPLPDADDLFKQIRKRIKAGSMKSHRKAKRMEDWYDRQDNPQDSDVENP